MFTKFLPTSLTHKNDNEYIIFILKKHLEDICVNGETPIDSRLKISMDEHLFMDQYVKLPNPELEQDRKIREVIDAIDGFFHNLYTLHEVYAKEMIKNYDDIVNVSFVSVRNGIWVDMPLRS